MSAPVPNDRSDSSSSVDLEVTGGSGVGEDSDSINANSMQSGATVVPSPVSLSVNVKCACGEHPGKEMLNQVYALSVNYLWECLFGHTTFCRNYWESRKFSNIKVGEWKLVSMHPFRQLEYNVDLGGAIGRPKNLEEQVSPTRRINNILFLKFNVNFISNKSIFIAGVVSNLELTNFFIMEDQEKISK